MDENSRTKIINAFEKGLQQGGIANIEDAGKAVGLLAEFLAQRVRPFLSREALDTALKSATLTADETDMLVAISEDLPSVMRLFFQMLSVRVAKEFPAVSPGRPRVLNASTHRAVCEYVGKLHTEGAQLKAAKQRAAQKYGISLSTVERAWKQRKTTPKPSPADVLNFIQSHFKAQETLPSKSSEGNRTLGANNRTPGQKTPEG